MPAAESKLHRSCENEFREQKILFDGRRVHARRFL